MTNRKEIRLGKRGQMVLPKEIRDALDLHEGDPLLVTMEGGKVVLVPAAQYARITRGMLSGTWGRTPDEIAHHLEAERNAWRG